jgi:hypothetical protein
VPPLCGVETAETRGVAELFLAAVDDLVFRLAIKVRLDFFWEGEAPAEPFPLPDFDRELE